MSTQFNFVNCEGHEKPVGVRFAGGRARGTCFEFFVSAAQVVEMMTAPGFFRDENGNAMSNAEFAREVAECSTTFDKGRNS